MAIVEPGLESKSHAPDSIVDRKQQFELHRMTLNNAAQRVAAILGGVLVPTFSILDWFIVRGHFGSILILRIIVAAYAWTCLALSKTSRGQKNVSFLSTSLVSSTALAIAAMVYMHTGYKSPYYAGIMLVAVGAGTLYRWNAIERLATFGSMCVGYFLPMFWQKITEPSILISNSFFLISTVIIVASAQGHSVRVARREFFANLDLQSTKSSLETAYERLRELDRLKSQFFSNITHELRTPLTMILAPIDGMLEGEFGNLQLQQREYLRPIRQNALKLLKLINDLLDLAKIDEQFLKLRLERTDCAGLVAEIIEQSRPLAARKDITLDFEVMGSADDVYVDPDRLERAIVNVLSNALKFTGPGGHVRVWISASDTGIQIGVADTGIGVPQNQLDRIFERFSQADGSVTRQFGGTGIGLSLAKEIVELHGGHMTVTSEEGEGSEFVIHLLRGESHFNPDILERRQGMDSTVPHRRGEDREPREWTRMLLERKDYRYFEIQEATERRIATRGDGRPKSNKILVVEDNTEVLRFLNMQLNEDYDVYLAPNGVKGFELAQREMPDVIITDYMMPEMDGLTLLRKLRAEPRTQNIPVIMLTAKSQVQNRIESREAGAEVFLNKPFSPRELRSSVSQLLEQRGRQLSYALHEQVKSLEHISAGLAHEIHNPLNYIKTALFVIDEVFAEVRAAAAHQDRIDDIARLVREKQDRVQRMQAVAQKGVARIARIVDLVRSYAREGYVRDPSAIDVDELIRNMALLLAPTNECDIHVDLDLLAQGAEVKCIAEDLQQAIGNIWQNAFDVLESGGRVTVRTRVEGEWVFVEIHDNGPGIPRDQLSQIFAPFFTTKGPGKGLGLGLSIAYQVISQAGGTISVDSVQQRGTVFSIRLPRLLDATSAPPKASSSPRHAAVSA